VAAGVEEVQRALELAGEIRMQLAEWQGRYRLPSGDFAALQGKVEELAELLGAVVDEMRSCCLRSRQSPGGGE